MEENPDLSKCVAGKHNSAVTDFSDCCACSLVYPNLIEFLGSSMVSQWQDFDLKTE